MESIDLLEERERKLRKLDESIARGLADIEAGRTKSVDEVFDRLEKRFSAKLVGQ